MNTLGRVFEINASTSSVQARMKILKARAKAPRRKTERRSEMGRPTTARSLLSGSGIYSYSFNTFSIRRSGISHMKATVIYRPKEMNRLKKAIGTANA